MNEYGYNKLNENLKQKYGERVLKICVDGGFTCPNRDGLVGTGGCIFCSERGSGDHIDKFLKHENVDISNKDIAGQIQTQVETYFNSYKAERANKFIVYFQNYTNTYDSIESLKLKYDSALIDDRIIVLDVATRADCINEDVCKLLSSYKEKGLDVWVELGLQTANDDLGKALNRGYTTEQVTRAVKLLNKYNLDCILHMMIGLPGETDDSINQTIEYLNSLNYQGLKIHSTYVVENTKLADLYKNGKYQPMELDYYIEKACYVLTHINPNVVIHKLSGDAPKNYLLAPEWNSHKKLIMNGIHKYLKENNLQQGLYYKYSK